jgi:hypothetical protein
MSEYDLSGVNEAEVQSVAHTAHTRDTTIVRILEIRLRRLPSPNGIAWPPSSHLAVFVHGRVSSFITRRFSWRDPGASSRQIDQIRGQAGRSCLHWLCCRSNKDVSTMQQATRASLLFSLSSPHQR